MRRFLFLALWALALPALAAPYLGDYVEDETLHFMWHSSDSSGASVTRATNGGIWVYKDNADGTEVQTGVTDTEDFDSLTGVHVCTIVLTDAFYAAGADYTIVLKAATIDSQVVNAVLGHFSVQNRYTRGTDSAALAATALTDVTWSDTKAGYLDEAISGLDDNAWDDGTRTLTSAANITDDAGTINVTAGAIDTVTTATTATTCTTASTCTALGAGAVDATAVADNAIDAGAIAAGAITSSEAPNLDATISSRGTSTLTQTQVTGGAYALDSDANGRIRIVDGTGTGEVDTASGAVLTRSTLMIEKNQAFTNFPVWLFDADGAALTGLSDIACRVSLDGAASSALTDTTEAEVDSGNVPGLYVVDFTAGELNGNHAAIICTATGAAPYRTIVTPQR